MTLLCLWQYLRTVTPDEAAEISGLSVPFAEVVERAVATVKVTAKRSKSPGVIHWSSKQRGDWFADLLGETVVFEKPKSALAKEIRAAMELTRNLTPADLDHFTEGRVLEIGGVNLMGQLWLIPCPDPVLQSLGSLPGATVAFLPVESGEAVGSLLSVLAGRTQAESERVVGEMEGIQRETNRRRLMALREQAEGIARLASWIDVDMTVIGETLLEAERAIRGHLKIRAYPKPLSFVPQGKPAKAPYPPPKSPAPKTTSRVERDLPQLTAPPPPPLVGDTAIEIGQERPQEEPPPERSMRRVR